MSVVLFSDLCKVFRSCSIFLHVLPTCISKEDRCNGRLGSASLLEGCGYEGRYWIGTVWEELLERADVHFFETECQYTVRLVGLDGLSSKEEGGATRGAVVVHVEDGNSTDAHFVAGALT